MEWEKFLKITGNFVVEMLDDDGSQARFFKNREDAARFVASLNRDALIRKSNLEDVFIKITGRKVID